MTAHTMTLLGPLHMQSACAARYADVRLRRKYPHLRVPVHHYTCTAGRHVEGVHVPTCALCRERTCCVVSGIFSVSVLF